jgi:glycosyltransferase involved in cell wall biosynthesis
MSERMTTPTAGGRPAGRSGAAADEDERADSVPSSAPTGLVTVVSPVFNEALGVREFYERATRAMTGIQPPVAHELLFVDDGSTDGSDEVLRQLAAEDNRVRVVSLSRNFGHQLAITSGMDHAYGDAVVVIDSDLQDPPEVIADMVASWRSGYQVVYGVRTSRAGESAFKLLTAKVFYRMINSISETPLPADSGDFRLLDQRVVEQLRQIREENRYIRGLVSWVGFKQTAVEYERDPRFAGESKFTVRKMFRFAVDAVTSFSERPLRFAVQVGAVVTLLTLLLAAWIIIGRLVSPEESFPGFASLAVIVLFLGGVQLLSIGLLGEYIGRIYRESKRRPLYVVAERVGFEQGSAAGLPGHEGCVRR